MLFGVGCGSSGQETTFRGAAGNVDVRFTVLLMDCYVWVTSPPRWKEFNSARGYRVVRFSSAVESVLVVAEQPNDPKRGVDFGLAFRELPATSISAARETAQQRQTFIVWLQWKTPIGSGYSIATLNSEMFYTDGDSSSRL